MVPIRTPSVNPPYRFVMSRETYQRKKGMIRASRNLSARPRRKQRANKATR